MPDSKVNAGGIPLKILIPVGVLVFFLSTFFSYSLFHHKEAAAPGKTPPVQTARVPEAVTNPEENAPAEATPSGIASEPAVATEPSPSQALPQESTLEAKPVASAQTAKPQTQVETAVSKPKASPEKSPVAAANPSPKPETAKTAPRKTEIAKAAPVKAEVETEVIPVLTQPEKEKIAKAPTGKNQDQLKLQIGTYPDLKTMLQDLNRVKELGFEAAFEEKETEGKGKDYFLILDKVFNEGEAKAYSLKLKVVHKLENTIKTQPGGKGQVWIGPFEKLTEVAKTTKMLKDEGYETRVQIKKKPGKKVFLFAGPFASKIDMIKAKAVLKKNGFSPEAPALP